jgi:YVTN family beta-propeller protein
LAATLPAAPSGGGSAKELVFVSTKRAGNLIIIDRKTNAVVNDLKISRRPRDMHLSADHTTLYVACGDQDVVDIIDVATLAVVGKLSTGSSPETLGIGKPAVASMSRTRNLRHRYRSEHHRAAGADRPRAGGRAR